MQSRTPKLFWAVSVALKERESKNAIPRASSPGKAIGAVLKCPVEPGAYFLITVLQWNSVG